jgi:excisionase family DNA binding protein
VAHNRTPLFVRLPKAQAAALDRLADSTGRAKQHLVSELLADRLVPTPLSVGRAEVMTNPLEVRGDDVLTLEEVAALFKLPPDAIQTAIKDGQLPGRRFGKEWRFSRSAVLAWLSHGDSGEQGRRR